MRHPWERRRGRGRPTDEAQYQVGDSVRVTGNSNHNDYELGEVVEILQLGVGSAVCRRRDGTVGNNLSFDDCEPAEVVGWRLLEQTLPREIARYLTAWEGFERTRLRPEVVDGILAALPPDELVRETLAHAGAPQASAASREGEEDEEDDGDMGDEDEGDDDEEEVA